MVLVGLNRGSAPYEWKIRLDDGEQVSQVFTASGELAKFKVEQKEGEAIVTVPAVDGIVLRVLPKN
jgi:hypothetical protein